MTEPSARIRPRLFYQNYLADATLVASSEALGIIGSVQREGAGDGLVEADGVFASTQDRDFIVRIFGSGSPGVATYYWSRDAEVLSSSGVLFTSTTSTVLVDGVEVAFPSGEFEESDAFRFKAVRPHGVEKMVDGDRDTEFRTADATLSVRITADFGSALTAQVLALMDHNFTAAAVVSLLASNVAGYSPLAVNAPVAVPLSNGTPTGKIVHYLGHPDRTHRYWAIDVSDPGNPDGYLRWSEAYLGPYLELPLRLGDNEAIERPSPRRRMQSGRWAGL